ncbi:ATP-dependent RNA helicase, DEAD box containing [Alteracholeplasma palmae J233]|uniref:ATP-dependent RNA helicase, DEAD box containing n=1 Tax=Alteracholeplasma palmae (strain ATCC 49389 / J233) TaxID=1318466 RepID=U4KS21_ALTPJ|nr:DEAD/DEAH box helicase [Alteracholeplasma palmae]CCV64646.1 ATP-dependent RNA helicase, DEAD box containing [Alteracholeplasma palmae J233]
MDYIKEKLELLKFDELSPIQKEVFKNFKEQKNIVGLAPTGTGKTHAYLLPILSQINKDLNEVQAIILVPTNELVIQVNKMLKEIDEDIISKAYYGGNDKKRELDWLNNNQPQVVITTPGKLHDYVSKENKLKIHKAKYLVLDEADMMFDEDFLVKIDAVIENLNPKILLFSATITETMEPFIKKYFGSSIVIDTTNQHTLDISYYLLKTKLDNKLETLRQLTQTINPYLAFIFVSKKEDQQKIFAELQENKVNVANFSSDLNMKVRKKMIEDIHKLKYQYVVASDLAARGIDFTASHVIHYDLPYHLEFFKHRSGRTGRMGKSGDVIVLYDLKESRKIDKIKKMGITFKNASLTKGEFVIELPKVKEKDEEIITAVKAVKKSNKVKPNHKKKYRAEVKKAIKKVKRSRFQ